MEIKTIIDLKDSYGLTCNHITPINGGWLNQLWKISTNRGELLVKKFSNERYNSLDLQHIESALQRQIILYKSGVPCSFILRYKDRIVRLLDDNTAYMVMEYIEGINVNADTITIKQINSLGSACGLMHKAFNKLPITSMRGFPIDNDKVLDSLWGNYYKRLGEITTDDPIGYKKAIYMQEPILKQLKVEFLDQLPKGIGHEDFTSDNILFNMDGVAAIVDFDRNCYNFIWHDIGRGILSFALKGNKLDIEKVNAFLDNYNKHLPLTLSNIADALRISWCIEIPWWIQPNFFVENKGKAGKYKDEILWVMENWFEIDSIIGS